MTFKRWQPQTGNVVAIATNPGGRWSVWSRSPERASWWLLPLNDEAKRWCEQHPHAVVTGAVSVPVKDINPTGKRTMP